MSHYIPKACPNCGANLDPDERCDCREHPYRGVPRAEPKLSREQIRAILEKARNKTRNFFVL